MAPSSRVPNLGQIIEYIPNRLYLASYVNPPTPDTLFPYPEPPAARSPSKRSQRAVDGPARVTSVRAHKQPVYFTVDDTLLYNAFHHDFGPLHIGHLYRFALEFHEILGAKENKDRPIVFWSGADPRSRANACCLLACYMILVQSWPPHLALAPIAQVDPPLMPFRDAGYSQADYGITVQDVIYGVWKAKEEGCCLVDSFDLDEYEKYERVEHGDFNWITPNFLAFASPQHSPVERVPEGSEAWAALPKTLAAVDAHPTLPQPYKNVLEHFCERDVGLVVRLNSALYSPSYFEALGIQHLDMIFEDGTCPPLSMVRKFVRLAHDMITVRKKSIAVHCKAGLGRTGCLIGAYLIYRHGFTANEIIAYMRFMRPGMVVGPQQHWLHLNQGVFREWWVEERLERKLRKEAALAAASALANNGYSSYNGYNGYNGSNGNNGNGNVNQPSTPIRAMQKTSLGRTQSHSKTGTSTPPNRVVSRTPLSELDQDRARDNSIGVQEDYLPAPTPGQPRKTQQQRHHPYGRNTVPQATVAEEAEGETQAEARAAAAAAAGGVRRETEMISVHHTSQGAAESDEEWLLRMRTHRKPSASVSVSTSASPDRSGSQRNQQQQQHHHHHHQTTTTTTTTVYVVDNDASNDVENIGTGASRAAKALADQHGHGYPARSSSASGVLTKVRGAAGASAKRVAASATVREAGVRKTSGRVGSVGGAASAAAAAAAARKISGL